MTFAEVLHIQFLRQGESARLTVARDLYAQNPLKLMLVVYREPRTQVGNKALTEALVVVNDNRIINPDQQPQNGTRWRSVGIEADINR